MGPSREDHVDSSTNDIGRKASKALRPACRIPVLEDDVFAFAIAEFLEPPAKRFPVSGRGRLRIGWPRDREMPDAVCLWCLWEGPDRGESHAHQAHEDRSPRDHSITVAAATPIVCRLDSSWRSPNAPVQGRIDLRDRRMVCARQTAEKLRLHVVDIRAADVSEQLH